MAKVQIKTEKITPFGGIFPIMDEFNRVLGEIVDSTLGLRSKLIGYQYSEIIRSLMCVYFCGGNTNVRFHQQDTLERMFLRLEGKGLKINRARMDCGSCSDLRIASSRFVG